MIDSEDKEYLNSLSCNLIGKTKSDSTAVLDKEVELGNISEYSLDHGVSTSLKVKLSHTIDFIEVVIKGRSAVMKRTPEDAN